MVRELWGGANVKWSYSETLGASGGMLIMWRKILLAPIYSFRGEGYMVICVEMNDRLTYYVNVMPLVILIIGGGIGGILSILRTGAKLVRGALGATSIQYQARRKR